MVDIIIEIENNFENSFANGIVSGVNQKWKDRVWLQTSEIWGHHTNYGCVLRTSEV